MKNRITLVAFATVAVLLLVELALAATDTDSATFDITISQIVLVDIYPNSTSWTTDVYPGNTTAEVDFTIENIGSLDIATIYLSNTEPSDMPFGTSTATNWNAGNLIEVSNDSGSNYYYSNRIEFNETTWPGYLTLTADTDGVGRFRFATNEYFWAIEDNGAEGNCTNGTIYIGTEPHNKSQAGDTDLTDGGITLSASAGSNYGINDATVAGQPFCVIANETCDAVRLVKWNMGTAPYDDAAQCDNDANLYSGTLNPGQSTAIKIRARIPLGIADGAISTGTLTVTASD